MPEAPNDKKLLLAGRIVSAVPVLLFLLPSAVFKLLHPPQMVSDWTGKFGFPGGTLLPIGLIELACTVIYLVPRTAVLGAVLLTGYLGGATVTHVRIGETPVAFAPVVLGGLVWLGLFLREPRPL